MSHVWKIDVDPARVLATLLGGRSGHLGQAVAEIEGATIAFSGVGTLIDGTSIDGPAVALFLKEDDAWPVIDDQARQPFDERYLAASGEAIESLADLPNVHVAFASD